MDIFRQIILPKLEDEVNNGEHFNELRQIYNAMVLATWVKNKVKDGLTKHKEVQKFANSNNPKSINMNIISVNPFSFDKSENSHLTNRITKIIEHNQPYSPAFEIPENVEFYNQYIRLFKNGLFRCARNEVGDSPDERIIRVYFSGAIDFRNLNENIHSKS